MSLYDHKPRKKTKYPVSRASRVAIIFGWWSDPVARLYVIAAQMSLIYANPDHKSHEEFGGEGRNSACYILVERMRNHHPSLYRRVLRTCCNKKYSGMLGVVHKLYERAVKATAVPEQGQAGKNEHYAQRKNPATAAEIREAKRMIVKM